MLLFSCYFGLVHLPWLLCNSFLVIDMVQGLLCGMECVHLLHLWGSLDNIGSIVLVIVGFTFNCLVLCDPCFLLSV